MTDTINTVLSDYMKMLDGAPWEKDRPAGHRGTSGSGGVCHRGRSAGKHL